MDADMRMLERSAAVGDARAAKALVLSRRRHGLPGYTLATFPPRFLASVHGGRPGALVRYPGGPMARRAPGGLWVVSGDQYVRQRCAKSHVVAVEVDVVLEDTTPLGESGGHGPLCARRMMLPSSPPGSVLEWHELEPMHAEHSSSCLKECLSDGILYAILARLDDGTEVEWGGVLPHGARGWACTRKLRRFVRRQRWFRLSPANPEIVWRTP